jgi:hypothetical protein
MGMGILATQSSAMSAVGIPGFVGVRPGGGLTWLQFELYIGYQWLRFIFDPFLLFLT